MDKTRQIRFNNVFTEINDIENICSECKGPLSYKHFTGIDVITKDINLLYCQRCDLYFTDWLNNANTRTK